MKQKQKKNTTVTILAGWFIIFLNLLNVKYSMWEKKTHTHIKRKKNELTKKKKNKQCRRKRKQKIMKNMRNKNNNYKKDAAWRCNLLLLMQIEERSLNFKVEILVHSHFKVSQNSYYLFLGAICNDLKRFIYGPQLFLYSTELLFISYSTRYLW